MSQFYKVVRGRVIHDGEAKNVGDFIFASPKEMEGIAGVGSVVRVEQGEVSFSFLQENGLLPATLPTVVSKPEIPTIPTVVSKPEIPTIPTVVSKPEIPTIPTVVSKPETPEAPTIPPVISDINEPDLGLSLGIDPVVKTEAVGKRNRSATA
jgi:hypothetical protein